MCEVVNYLGLLLLFIGLKRAAHVIVEVLKNKTEPKTQVCFFSKAVECTFQSLDPHASKIMRVSTTLELDTVRNIQKSLGSSHDG